MRQWSCYATQQSNSSQGWKPPHLPIILAKTKRPATPAGLFSSAPGTEDDFDPGSTQGRLANLEAAAGPLRRTKDNVQTQAG